MKKLIVSILLCVSAFVMAQTPKDDFKSTEILPNNQAAFRIFAPNAKSVSLSARMGKEKAEFKKNEQGVWEAIFSDVEPGAYKYGFYVDGVRTFDPKASSSTEAASIFIMTDGNDFFTMKEDVPHGAISERFYKSETLNQMRRLKVWTPAGFEKSEGKLPVLYLIHGGGNNNDDIWASIGCAGNILDNLLADGKIEPMIVVMPNANIESDKKFGNLPLFRDDLMKGIIPFIESNYNVYTDSAHRAIMGLSMGGLQTLETAMSNYQDFNYICALSSGWWLADSWAKKRGISDDKELRKNQLNKIASNFNKSVKLMYFTQGGPEDLAYENGMETLNLFDEAGIKYKFSEMPGGHSMMVWRKNLRDLAPLLFK
ncbi:alpha/beta hydrolase-fold protein [Lutibacter citreus]|uniref:alpha/beta hydrolase-fold protein n=1 Tax=Lutibacter citreus TaxID=2138210 RepID=UPI000DBE16D2|nr:alpha/beta hydrolase-fold protein [Lutibacter citreus]